MSCPDYRLFVSPQAQQDIAGILRYTGKTWGRNQLLIYRDKLDEAMKTIGHNPNLGHGSPELPETHRLYFVGSVQEKQSESECLYFQCSTVSSSTCTLMTTDDIIALIFTLSMPSLPR